MKVEHLVAAATELDGAVALVASLCFQVETRAESAPRASDDDGAHVPVYVRRLECRGKCGQHRPGDSVQAVGAVERDREDVAVLFEQQLVGRGWRDHGVATPFDVKECRASVASQH